MAKEDKKTPEELQKEFLDNRNKEDKERKAAEIKAGFLNPLGDRTTLAEFIEAVGKKTVSEYCKGHLTEDEIKALEIEINHLNNK